MKYGWKYNWNIILDKVYKTFITKETAIQSNKTPFEAVERAVKKFSSLSGRILVFNIEFAIYLIEEKKINPDNIVAWYDNNGKMALYVQLGIFKFLDSKDLFSVKHIYNVKTGEYIDMKFDRVIGNPPYDSNLHLKMLKHIHDNFVFEDWEIVWIHPARWAQDPLAKYKGNRSDFIKYKNLSWNELEIISRGEANKIFGIKNDSDLTISFLSHNNIVVPKVLNNLIYIITDKVINKKDTIKDHIDTNQINGVRVPIKNIVPVIGSGNRDFTYKFFAYRLCDNYYTNNGYLNSGVYWTESMAKNQFKKDIGDPLPLSIKFNTEIEAQNFIDCCNIEIYKFICIIFKTDMHIYHAYLPYMGDYTHSWTNEDLIKYFGFTDEEVVYIYKILEAYS